MVYLISDTFSRINLASQRRAGYVITLNSSFCLRNLFLIYMLGYIHYIKVINFKYLKVGLKYHFGSSCLRGVYALSKNKNKIYVSCSSIKSLISKNKFLTIGFLGISTSKTPFLHSDVECVIRNLGGLAVFYVN